MSGINMSIVFLAIVFVVFVVSFIIYYVIYNKKINERVKNQESMVHNSMVPIHTMGKSCLIIFGVIVIFSIFGELSSLRSNIEAQWSSLSHQIADVEMEVSDLEEKLEKQNSLVSQFKCIVGKVDADYDTVEVELICIPKMYSKDTKLTLMNGDKKIVLKNNGNGEFSAKQTFPIFENFEEESTIQQEDAGVITTSKEKNLIGDSLVNDCLPTLGDCDSTFGVSKGNGSVVIDGDVLLGEDKDYFESLELYVVKNSERIQELNVMDESFSVKVPVDDDDTVMVVLSGMDQYGYLHKCIVGALNGDDDSMGKGDAIYNAEGMLLYGPEIE